MTALEGRIDDLSERFEMPTEFVVPGDNRSSAALDVARTVVRRAERLVHGDPDRGITGRPLPQPPLRSVVDDGPLEEGDEHVTARDRRRSTDGRPISVTSSSRWWRPPARPRRPGGRGGPGLAGPRRSRAARRARRRPACDRPTTSTPAWCTRQGFTAKVGQVLALRASDGRPACWSGWDGRGPSTPNGGAGRGRGLRAGGRGRGHGRARAARGPRRPGRPPRRSAPRWPRGRPWPPTASTGSETRARPGGRARLVVVPSDPACDRRWPARRRRGGRRAVSLARDLVNTPPGDLPPHRLAEEATALLEGRPGPTVEVWDEHRIAEERLGGLLGVSQGSAQPPRLIRAHYQPAHPVELDGRVPHVVLVGKGITFDSGGLSLKTADGMTTMKTDMSGAAIVLAALAACADLDVAVEVTALAPVTENMPGSRAIKPGDVLTIRNGTTIEVLNTDAEGRLVLADAPGAGRRAAARRHRRRGHADRRGRVALGTWSPPMFANATDSGRASAAPAAGPANSSGPSRMPEDYAEHVDSDVADMKNIGRPARPGPSAPP